MNQIAKQLIDIDAVKINVKEKFTWASGVKSPIYIDNRLIISYPKIRKEIENKLAKIILDNFSECDYIIGIATGAIAHAAYISNILELPMGYVRLSNKTHGKKNNIEGKLSKRNKIVVIEDTLSTGMSSLQAVNILKDKGYNVIGLVSIFTYNTIPLKENLKGINHKSLLNIDDILNVYQELNHIDENESLKIKDFINNIKI